MSNVDIIYYLHTTHFLYLVFRLFFVCTYDSSVGTYANVYTLMCARMCIFIFAYVHGKGVIYRSSPSYHRSRRFCRIIKKNHTHTYLHISFFFNLAFYYLYLRTLFLFFF